MTTATREQTVLPPDDRHAVADLVQLLTAATQDGLAVLHGPSGMQTALPEQVCRVLLQVVRAMADGMAITVAPHNTLLTTQEAADLLSISRPTLVRLLEAGEIPYSTRGRHRRVLLADVVEYQQATRDDRRATLDEMARDGGDAGLYEATLEPPQ
jgi:excisionase family DNA binding protein